MFLTPITLPSKVEGHPPTASRPPPELQRDCRIVKRYIRSAKLPNEALNIYPKIFSPSLNKA
eukprot:1393725-Amorphochlora_amoeboformis.AAC.1